MNPLYTSPRERAFFLENFELIILHPSDKSQLPPAPLVTPSRYNDPLYADKHADPYRRGMCEKATFGSVLRVRRRQRVHVPICVLFAAGGVNIFSTGKATADATVCSVSN